MALRSPLTVQPYDYIADSNGRPLDYGQVYIGVANQDPEFYQIPVFLDAAMTKPIDQPIRTNDGFVDFAGSLSELYASAEIYSVKVLDKQGRKVIYKAEMMRDNLTDDAITSLNAAITELQAQAVLSTTQAVKDALNSAAIDNNTQVDTLITATPQGVGMVARTQAQVNSETVSLLDFGAPYSTDSTTHLQKAIDYLDSVGGGKLVIPYHTGTLVISGAITLRPNIEIDCDKNLIVDCTLNESTFQFVLSGSIGAEIPTALNLGIGDENITLTTTHNYAIDDDVLIVSQRGCAHADAGAEWRLGETTSGTNSPFFAEPLVVNKITSTTAFQTNSRLIFPNYRTDKTQETMVTARDRTTVQKMNLAKGFSWVGGVFKKNKGSIFHLIWSKYAEVDISVMRGYGTGAEVYNRYSLASDITVKVKRPADMVIVGDHSGYNSVKDVSSWYTEVDLYEENGVQGLDQSYMLYCGIAPIYKVKHINPKEDGMTTHGCVYKVKANVFATNSKRSVFNNRARFCEAVVGGIGCTWGVTLSGLGSQDGDFNLNLSNNSSHAVYLLSEGVTSITPSFKNSVFSGRVVMSPRNVRVAFSILPNLDENNPFTDSGISFKDLSVTAYFSVFDIQSNIYGIDFDNVKITYFGSQSPITFNGNTGHSIRGLTVDFKESTGNNTAIEVINPVTRDKKYGRTGNHIDYNSCKFINCKAVNKNTDTPIQSITLSGTSSANQRLTVNSSNLADFYSVSITTAGRGFNRLVLDNSIPIGFTFSVLMSASIDDVELVFYVTDATTSSIKILDSIGNSDNSIAGIVSMPKMFFVKKIADGSFIVYN